MKDYSLCHPREVGDSGASSLKLRNDELLKFKTHCNREFFRLAV
jgi:hypothetical protein